MIDGVGPSAGLRRTLAVGCRILAVAGLADGLLGHISARVDDRSLLVRCRGPRERGLRATEPDDIRHVGFDGAVLDGGAEAGYSPPQELPIHARTMERHPAVGAVVHAHPPAVVAADLAGLPFVPLVGSFDIPAARLATDGIPSYPRGVLIRRPELADEMLDAMGERPVCVLRGHGITTVGATVEQAVARALALDSLARMMCRVAALGGPIVALPKEDLAELPDLGAAFNEGLLWRLHEQRLVDAGAML
jgi:3,4-dihydroxyphthalate decarboxylase